MLIVEELHMLLLRPDGRVESSVSVNRLYGEVAAVIVDLALHGRITMANEKNPVVEIVSTEPTGNPILDTTLERLVPLRGKRLQSLVVRPKLDPLEVVVESLVVQGVLIRGERGFFGWGSARTPESDSTPERALRARLAAVLAGTLAPTKADLALLSILQNLNAAHAILRDECGGLSSRDLKKRIEELTAGSAAGDAVARAVNAAITAALMAAMTPVVVAATVS
ncbi:GPP34 family phosphoprotein [uncultured Microbacterium sp.]|uniref:GOLPH3/VPS74 family protein n=1 Tax=uncultured Microbacterium sp. TaxID=191216 RepID=UPI0028D332F8|nr:GPP34 family phosphoprotein [uncultured Microbacterium sp.]